MGTTHRFVYLAVAPSCKNLRGLGKVKLDCCVWLASSLVNNPCSPQRCEFAPGRPGKVKFNAVGVPYRARCAETGRPRGSASGICPTRSQGAQGAPQFAAAPPASAPRGATREAGASQPSVSRGFGGSLVLLARPRPRTRAPGAPRLASAGIAILGLGRSQHPSPVLRPRRP